MEVYSSNMSEASVCQLKQLPCHSAPLLRLQGGGHHTNNLPSVACKSWTNGSPSAGASSTVHHRGSGVTAGTCSNPECAASRLVEEVVAARGSSKGKVVVTGGAGYFGFSLGKELAGEGMSVILMDLNKPPNEIPDGAVFYQSDIRDYSSLYKVCEGVDCIFHTASYGMSGPEQLRKELIESVNIGGTSNVINVCKERGIPRLVYTSTINVVFAGEPIVNGDEASVPYVPSDLHRDYYSRTKTVAEKMVLSANGSSLKDGGILRTCALRPSGIYGPEERRHFDRLMENVGRGFFSFKFGDPEAQMNWVHVDNLVLAHRLAAESLTQKRSCVASGQAYFINDGDAANGYEWMAPLFEKLGHSQPTITVPISLVYSAALLVEYLHLILRPVIKVPLLFTRCECVWRSLRHGPLGPHECVMKPETEAELRGALHLRSSIPQTAAARGINDCPIRHISVGHTFKIDKARRELGYCPKRYSLADAFNHYLKTQVPRSGSSSTSVSLTSHLLRYFVLLLLMGLSLLLLMFSGIL